MSIENPEDREEYLREMLDPDQSKSFFEELRNLETRRNAPADMYAYKKSGSHEPTGGARPKSGAVSKGRPQVRKYLTTQIHVRITQMIYSCVSEDLVALYWHWRVLQYFDILLSIKHICFCQATKLKRNVEYQSRSKKYSKVLLN